MTTEQNHTIHRCKAMIKRAFSDMTGKIIFRLDSSRAGEKGISVDMFIPDLKISTKGDSKQINTVDLS